MEKNKNMAAGDPAQKYGRGGQQKFPFRSPARSKNARGIALNVQTCMYSVFDINIEES